MDPASAAAESELHAILARFDVAVLLTHAEDDPARLRGRPMRIAGLDADDTVYFFAAIDSEKVREALARDDAYVVVQSPGVQAVLHGRVAITQDKDRIDELWFEDEDLFFEAGREDARVCLLCFTPEDGDYWTELCGDAS